jgi:hypothetical protein
MRGRYSDVSHPEPAKDQFGRLRKKLRAQCLCAPSFPDSVWEPTCLRDSVAPATTQEPSCA